MFYSKVFSEAERDGPLLLLLIIHSAHTFSKAYEVELVRAHARCACEGGRSGH